MIHVDLDDRQVVLSAAEAHTTERWGRIGNIQLLVDDLFREIDRNTKSKRRGKNTRSRFTEPRA